MHKYLLIFTAIFFIFFSKIKAQQTVGLLDYSNETVDGYTLFSPLNNKETYLINNCGEKVHSWTSNYTPGVMAYLLEDATLLRSGNPRNTTFVAGGQGGVIELVDWEGNVLWDLSISNDTMCLHHDIEYLPNGNILAIVWDLYDIEEAEQAGKTELDNVVWSEKIIEIKPDLTTGGFEIVWE